MVSLLSVLSIVFANENTSSCVRLCFTDKTKYWIKRVNYLFKVNKIMKKYIIYIYKVLCLIKCYAMFSKPIKFVKCYNVFC